MHMSLGARLACAFMYCCRLFPIQKNKIVFSSFFGQKYNDSPRAISEELSAHQDIRQIWILPEGVKHPENIKAVPPQSLASLFHLATARVWVDNSRKRGYIRKRKNQFYIQTWHGGVCLKRVEGDALDGLTPAYIESAKNDSKMADVFISACEWRTKQYRSAFWYNGEVMKCGLPRNRIYHQDIALIKGKVWDFFSLKPDVHIILYAPTFRSGNRVDAYCIHPERVLDAYSKRYGGSWVFLVRLHPAAAHLDCGIRYTDRVLNATAYGDINELIMCSDVLITDYSGCLFDAFHLRKKAIIFAPDLEEYLSQDRQLYFNIRELPAPVAENNDELINTIETIDLQDYSKKIEAFESEMGYYPDENAASEICSRIVQVMHSEKQ
ncbi:MAG: CDP-glycerol glycerophosphotransferase family protein [Dehalococcoidales bacterium]|nr:CDP-glycerol glycerophosphotransferase family protein [Dehalococcoidales bacterium]